MAYKETPDHSYKKQLLKELYGEEPGPIETRVRQFVERIEVTDPKKLAEAEVAYSIARLLDYDTQNTSANVIKELRNILDGLSKNKSEIDGLFSGPM